MFLAELKANIVLALRDTFDSNYPELDFQDLKVSIEYPDKIADYPSIWVDFEPTQNIETISIDSIQYSGTTQFKTWRFQGYATFTIVALSSLERDRLFDEVVKVIAFGEMNEQRSTFRKTIDNNDLIAMNMDFDSMAIRGSTASMGTPWGSDDIIYEITCATQILGEFSSDVLTGELLLLSEIEVTEEIDNGPTINTFIP